MLFFAFSSSSSFSSYSNIYISSFLSVWYDISVTIMDMFSDSDSLTSI